MVGGNLAARERSLCHNYGVNVCFGVLNNGIALHLDRVSNRLAIGGNVVVNSTAKDGADNGDVIQGELAAGSHGKGSAVVRGDGVTLCVDDDILADGNGAVQSNVADQGQRSVGGSRVDRGLKIRISLAVNDRDSIVVEEVTLDSVIGGFACRQDNAFQLHGGVCGNTVIGEGGTGYVDVHVSERYRNVARQVECLLKVSGDVGLVLTVDGQALIKGNGSVKHNVLIQVDHATFGGIGNCLCQGIVQVDFEGTRACKTLRSKHSSLSVESFSNGDRVVGSFIGANDRGSVQAVHASAGIQIDYKIRSACGSDSRTVSCGNAILSKACPILIDDSALVKGERKGTVGTAADCTDQILAAGNDRIRDGQHRARTVRIRIDVNGSSIVIFNIALAHDRGTIKRDIGIGIVQIEHHITANDVGVGNV